MQSQMCDLQLFLLLISLPDWGGQKSTITMFIFLTLYDLYNFISAHLYWQILNSFVIQSFIIWHCTFDHRWTRTDTYFRSKIWSLSPQDNISVKVAIFLSDGRERELLLADSLCPIPPESLPSVFSDLQITLLCILWIASHRALWLHEFAPARLSFFRLSQPTLHHYHHYPIIIIIWLIFALACQSLLHNIRHHLPLFVSVFVIFVFTSSLLSISFLSLSLSLMFLSFFTFLLLSDVFL